MHLLGATPLKLLLFVEERKQSVYQLSCLVSQAKWTEVEVETQLGWVEVIKMGELSRVALERQIHCIQCSKIGIHLKDDTEIQVCSEYQ